MHPACKTSTVIMYSVIINSRPVHTTENILYLWVCARKQVIQCHAFYVGKYYGKYSQEPTISVSNQCLVNHPGEYEAS